MRSVLSAFAVTLSLAAAPTLALAGTTPSTGPSAAAVSAVQPLAQSNMAQPSHEPSLLTDKAMSKIVGGTGTTPWTDAYDGSYFGAYTAYYTGNTPDSVLTGNDTIQNSQDDPIPSTAP